MTTVASLSFVEYLHREMCVFKRFSRRTQEVRRSPGMKVTSAVQLVCDVLWVGLFSSDPARGFALEKNVNLLQWRIDK